MQDKLLVVKDLTKHYGRKAVVSGVSYEVDAGEIVGLLGPNGAGKTTAFRMTMGLIPPESGQVMFKGEDITKLEIYLRARRGMGYLAQEPSVFQGLTVEENVLAVLESLAVQKRYRATAAARILDEFGLTPLRKRKAYNLSGGERRRLEITRAMATNPAMLLLDEPFSGVDPIAVDDIQKTICKLRDRGIGILLTDHNVREALSVTDRSYMIHKGRIWRHGTPEELIRDEEVRHAYLGRDFEL